MKRKIPNHYRGRRYAKKRYPRTFERSVYSIDAERFIEAITLAYCAGLAVGTRQGIQAGWDDARAAREE
jgi:hypothetical protein